MFHIDVCCWDTRAQKVCVIGKHNHQKESISRHTCGCKTGGKTSGATAGWGLSLLTAWPTSGHCLPGHRSLCSVSSQPSPEEGQGVWGFLSSCPPSAKTAFSFSNSWNRKLEEEKTWTQRKEDWTVWKAGMKTSPFSWETAGTLRLGGEVEVMDSHPSPSSLLGFVFTKGCGIGNSPSLKSIRPLLALRLTWLSPRPLASKEAPLCVSVY